MNKEGIPVPSFCSSVLCNLENPNLALFILLLGSKVGCTRHFSSSTDFSLPKEERVVGKAEVEKPIAMKKQNVFKERKRLENLMLHADDFVCFVRTEFECWYYWTCNY